jgi:hypothetical protein
MMARPLFQQSLRDLLDRKPFKPFVIETDDGHRWEIDKRERLSYLAGDSALFVGQGEELSFLVCDNVRQIMEIGPEIPC